MVILLITVFTIPATLSLTKPGFFPTQDYIYVARVYQMNKALHDGQFPVRWVPDFRYGEPLFNFYAPLPYYAGALTADLGFSYLVTVKLLFGVGFLLSGLAMYLLAREFFGKIGGFLASIFYIYAPYHSVDVYVRGALSESWALIFFPLIFLTAYRLSESPSVKKMVSLALSLAGLFFTHNIMTILFMPFFIAWCIFLLWQKRSYRLVSYFIPALFLGVGIAASFLLPAFFEKEFVQSDKLIRGYFDFRGHFVAIPQFFSTFWGYGASLWGAKDDMSFQVGLAHWAAILTVLALAIKFRKLKVNLLIIFLTLEFLFSLFMQHNRSAPIWEAFSLLAFTQFPWRFLGISIFFASVLAGAVALYLPVKYQRAVALPVAVIVVLSYIGYFRPDSYYLDSVDSHYISEEILSKDDRLPKDYLPIWVKHIASQKLATPSALMGEAQINDFKKHSKSASFQINIIEDSVVDTPITYYPGWEVRANNNLVSLEQPGDLGLVRFKLPKGSYRVDMELKDTPIRAVANLISVVSILLAVLLVISHKKVKI